MLLDMRHDKPKGMSILEVIVSMSIMSIVLGSLVMMYLAHGKLFSRAQGASDLQGQMNLTLKTIGGMANVADSVLAGATVRSKYYASSATTTILSMPSIDSSGRPIVGMEDYAVFYLDPADSSRLLMSLQASSSSARRSSDRQLSDSVKTCAFRYDSATTSDTTTLSMAISMIKSVRDGNDTLQYDETYFLGNKPR